MGGLLSGILGGGESPGQAAQMQGLKASREDIQRYRPEAMQARLNALSNMSTAFQGANNALETIWGDPGGGGGKPSMAGMRKQSFMGHEMPQEGMRLGPPRGSWQGEQPRGPESFHPGLLDPAGIFRGR